MDQGDSAITLVCAPRGSGKSHLLARLDEEQRSRGGVAQWIDADAAEYPRFPDTADLVLIDNVDPRRQADVELVRSAVLAHRHDTIGRVVIASRSAELTNHLLFPWLHGYAVLRASDLALTRETIQDLAARSGPRVPPAIAELIRAESGGWAWAARVGISAQRERSDVDPAVLRREIRTRMRGSLLTALTPEQRLVFTATTTIDPRLLIALDLDIADAVSWLRTAEADGWVERASAESPYLVPAALSAALRSLPDEEPLLLDATRERLTHHLLSEGRVPEAIQVATAVDTPDLAVEVLRHSSVLGRFSDLTSIARSLSGKSLTWFGSHYDLLGTAILAGRGTNNVYAEWHQSAIEAISIAAPPLNDPLDRINFDTVRILMHRTVGDMETSLRFAEHLLTLWRRIRAQHPHLAGAAAIGLDIAAVTLFYNGEHRRAIGVELDALNCTARLEDLSMRRVSASALAGMQAVHGDMRSAAHTLELVRTLSDVTVPAYARVWWDWGLALTAQEQGDPDSARRHARDGLKGAEDTEGWWLAAYVHALTEHTAGAPHASRIYARAIARGEARGWKINVPEFHRLRLCELRILDGSIAEARSVLREHDEVSPYAQLLHGITDLALGDWSRARRSAVFAAPDSTPRAVVLRLLVLAASSAALGQPRVAAEHLNAALQEMTEWGLGSPMRFLTVEARQLLVSTAQLLDAESVSQLARLLEAHAAVPLVRHVNSLLTPREKEVLTLLQTGRTRPEIGEDLGISVNTVKTMTRRIYQKLGARNSAEALDHAIQAGFLALDHA